ncbi:hypothetical protein [Saccharothrix texasensis]|uniref:Uncharacterized protein n=1 Tax=Saccharothrix texasensis TaxID=103734 RepID=A0A3N1H4J1_9PSEU|nr:hypothetical protein [Saccharothrix texasensis]ROP37449.1 hypothetical protein EDD40_2762 [Saccharothrix texasensis]
MTHTDALVRWFREQAEADFANLADEAIRYNAAHDRCEQDADMPPKPDLEALDRYWAYIKFIDQYEHFHREWSKHGREDFEVADALLRALASAYQCREGYDEDEWAP